MNSMNRVFKNKANRMMADTLMDQPQNQAYLMNSLKPKGGVLLLLTKLMKTNLNRRNN